MLGRPTSNSFFLIVLTISFSVVVLPHSAIGSKKNNIEKFLPLKQELVKTKKTEERYKTIILRAKRKVTMLSDRLTEIGLKLKAQKQKKRQLLMAVISLSRYPKPSPISSTFLPLSITRTHTLMKLFSQQLNEEIRSLQSNNNKFSDLKTLISIESQKIDNANKKLILLHAEIDALIDKSIGRVTSTTLSNSNTFEKIYKMLKNANGAKCIGATAKKH